MLQVVAALIRQNGRLLVCRRPAHKAQSLLWEFAGGKLESGETPEQALRRECREELGVEICVGELFMELTHTYPDLCVHLRFYYAEIVTGEPQRREHAALKWVTAEEALGMDFCPADTPVLAKLAKPGYIPAGL